MSISGDRYYLTMPNRNPLNLEIMEVIMEIDAILKNFDGAFSENTIRAYRTDFIQYDNWCREHGKTALPTDAQTLAQYIDEMSLVCKSATIRRRIASLCTIYKLSRYPNPTNDPEVILAMKRMHRRIGRQQQQAVPLTREILNQMLATCDDSVTGMRNRVMLLLGYETLRRRSELCRFRFSDIITLPNKKHAIRLNFSKTDQYGQGKIIVISEHLYNCLQTWKAMLGEEDGYILRGIKRNGTARETPLSPPVISVLLKKIQAKAFENIEAPLSGHSFRVGAALDLLNDGYPLEKIMPRGGWRTESTTLRYLSSWVADV